MTDHDLRSLLRDQVADVTTTADLSAGAWRTSRGVRRRRTLGVVAGAAAATLLVVGGIAVLGNESDDTPDPAPPSPTPGVNTTPDGHFRGAPVYWSPSLPEEADLPVMTEGRPPLPEVIDLSAEATPVEDDPIDRAVAVFGVLDDTSAIRFLLLAPDGTYRTLDLSDVGPDPIVDCCERPPLRDTMLSPTGSTSRSRSSTACWSTTCRNASGARSRPATPTRRTPSGAARGPSTWRGSRAGRVRCSTW